MITLLYNLKKATYKFIQKLVYQFVFTFIFKMNIRYIHIVFFLISFNQFFSQNDLDVLRYSQPSITGDARFIALGGSMGALGANLSCVNFNPAGIGLYRKGEFNASLGLQTTTCQANYNNTKANDFRINLFIGNLGFANSMEEESPFKDETSRKKFKDWSRRHVISITYNKLAQFQQNITIKGNSFQQTIINDFLGAAQNYAPSQLNPFYEGLAFNTYLIDTIPGSITDYGTYFYLDKSFQQQKTIQVSGGINSYGFNYAYALDNKHYFGASVGVLSGKWNYDASYEESDLGDSTAYFKSLKLTEVIQTRSIGINLKLGYIARLSEFFRVGAYIHTPSAISLTDGYSNRIDVSYDSLFGQKNVFINDSVGPGNFKYKIKTPTRIGISGAFLFNKLISINIDAEYMNYQKGNLSSKTYSFKDVNNAMQSKYSQTINYRCGVEWNISPISLRLGYAALASPFGNSFSGAHSRQYYSFGAGWQFQPNRYVDVAIVYKNWKENYYLFQPSLVNKTELKFNQVIIQMNYVVRF